jgi:hypothetical protein
MQKMKGVEWEKTKKYESHSFDIFHTAAEVNKNATY